MSRPVSGPRPRGYEARFWARAVTSAATTTTDSDPKPAKGKEDSILSDPPGSDDETGPRLEYSGKTLLSASPKGGTS